MSYQYIVLRDADNNPSYFAMLDDKENLDWLYRLYKEGAIYEEVELRNPTGGDITKDKHGTYETTGFDMDLRANAEPEDGTFGTAQMGGVLKFIMFCDGLVILNKWVIPDGVINDGFMKSHEMTMGSFECSLDSEGMYHVTTLNYSRDSVRLRKVIENMLNTIVICC